MSHPIGYCAALYSVLSCPTLVVELSSSPFNDTTPHSRDVSHLKQSKKSFSPHNRLLRAMASKDALVKDLKARIETLTARENAHSTAAASDLAKEKAKYRDSCKAEKERDRESDVKDDKDRAPKPFVSSFGGGPSRCGTPIWLPPPPPPPPSGMTRSSSTGNIRMVGSKESPKGFDSDVAESEILSATAHLSASELRNR